MFGKTSLMHKHFNLSFNLGKGGGGQNRTLPLSLFLWLTLIKLNSPAQGKLRGGDLFKHVSIFITVVKFTHCLIDAD